MCIWIKSLHEARYVFPKSLFYVFVKATLNFLFLFSFPQIFLCVCWKMEKIDFEVCGCPHKLLLEISSSPHLPAKRLAQTTLHPPRDCAITATADEVRVERQSVAKIRPMWGSLIFVTAKQCHIHLIYYTRHNRLYLLHLIVSKSMKFGRGNTLEAISF